jgi:hypothetical protein
MRIILITTLFLLPISAVAAAELHQPVHRAPRHAIYANRWCDLRTPFFWPTPADLIAARRMGCAPVSWSPGDFFQGEFPW